ncbi:hypothetical protein Z949_953 [Sulfitobacter guttiformis KCTC 32187]|nr:hypothetical protein Z949_953 [Sulfitobacter guttiformis KCTC 32187]
MLRDHNNFNNLKQNTGGFKSFALQGLRVQARREDAEDGCIFTHNNAQREVVS